MKHRIYDESKVNNNLTDPMGWTIQNNPFPHEMIADTTDESDYRNWFEWENGIVQPSVCHMCLKRAKSGSGNCQDGGEYYAPCLEKKLKILEERKNGKPKKTYQSTLF